MTSTQPSKLLASVFQHVEQDQRVSVLDLGSAMPETVDFFSRYRSKLFFADLFYDLPINGADPDGAPLEVQFADLLPFPENSRFDICLFWDLFNYLDADAIGALLDRLLPCLHPGTIAHAFGLHNLRSPREDRAYGIASTEAFSVRERERPLPGYAPHSQRQLQQMLGYFSVERTVLLANSRLELLLKVRP
jgi:hypothetical protein